PWPSFCLSGAAAKINGKNRKAAKLIKEMGMNAEPSFACLTKYPYGFPNASCTIKQFPLPLIHLSFSFMKWK
uniref:Uncharacterized protein n=1 Tax=Zonotrichia albicollis TaxID=44394 RepID=A0A8D2MJK3_ZONAL